MLAQEDIKNEKVKIKEINSSKYLRELVSDDSTNTLNNGENCKREMCQNKYSNARRNNFRKI